MNIDDDLYCIDTCELNRPAIPRRQDKFQLFISQMNSGLNFLFVAMRIDSASVPGGSVLPHATSVRLRAAACLPAALAVHDAAVLPASRSTGLGYARLFPSVVNRNAILHLLLPGGDESAVLGRQSAQEAVVEVPHQVHDVVPAARRAQDYHRGIRTGSLTPLIPSIL